MSNEYYSSPPSSLSAIIQDPISNPNPNSSDSSKRKRGTPGNNDPEAEVIALSPRSLTAKDRFTCEICNKGFQRDQNLQLHRRGHNLPWKLKQRNKDEAVKKKVYICPETSCVHHDPSRALGDLTGVKKHFFRKHGEKKWKCEKCSKKYAVQSDWKAHNKICGTKEYKCDCGTIFNRKDSYITHRAFCHALTEQNSRMASFSMMMSGGGGMRFPGMLETNLDMNLAKPMLPIWLDQNGNDSHFKNPNNSFSGCASFNNNNDGMLPLETVQWLNNYSSSTTEPPVAAHMSATGLLQKAAQMGSTQSTGPVNMNRFGVMSTSLSNFDTFNHNNDDTLMTMMMNSIESKQVKSNGVNASHDSDFTRDFLGVGENERSFNLQQGLFKFSS
ncbi:protein indeterminate-domain 7-like isoform X1 [Bidens hawaiensis]|uniref:protein indeterminate-domain 7-like isoform X1 n=1 Tax=Bidens hawaiensis TaxID=980011 RepID=UPI00404BA229